MNSYFLKISFTFIIVLLVCRLSYSQTEDKKYDIDEINIKFRGTISYEENDLKNLLAAKEGDVFDMTIYLSDVERIKKYYFDNGYFDTKVDTNLRFNRKDNEVIENFIVKENKRYVYYDIKYVGVDSLDAPLIKQIKSTNDIFLRTGEYYSKDTIKLEVNRVLNILFNNGYATATAESPEIFKYETNDSNLLNKVNVTFIFKPRLRYEFGTTTINIITKKYNLPKTDISRELTYLPNQIYNKSEVVNSELNLAKITILDNPRIEIERVDSVNNKIYFVINAVVGNKYGLTPEVFGYYIQNLFYIGVGMAFSDNYFFGGGRILTSRARVYYNSINNNQFEFVNSINQPFLFNNRNITGTWNIGAQYYLDETSRTAQVKNSFQVAYQLPNYTFINNISARWDVINERISLREDLIIDSSLIIPKFDLNLFQSIIGLNFIHNTVNNIQFPTKGNFQSFDFEESGALGYLVQKLFNTQTVSYLKFTNFNSAYLNLSRNKLNPPAALAGKVLAGIIAEYGKDTYTFLGSEINYDRVPTNTRYLCGGSTSIRGWGAKQLGIVPDKSVGGNFIIENSVEYRIRPFLEADNTYIRDLGFTTFVDFGNTWSEIGKFKFNELALASGGGLRYYTIVGAIRLDLGFKIYDPQPGPVGGSNWIFGPGCNFSNKYTLQFGIGNTF